MKLPKNPTADDYKAYNDWCNEQRKDCKRNGHKWRSMSENEAYPASYGRVCTHCDLCDLHWF
jgi:hypothetical protein